MNETMSLFLVATVLAIGGAGLYMFKLSDESVQDDTNDLDNNYNESIFDNYDEYDDEIIEQPKTKSRGGSKTKRSRKNSGTKRRY